MFDAVMPTSSMGSPMSAWLDGWKVPDLSDLDSSAMLSLGHMVLCQHSRLFETQACFGQDSSETNPPAHKDSGLL